MEFSFKLSNLPHQKHPGIDPKYCCFLVCSQQLYSLCWLLWNSCLVLLSNPGLDLVFFCDDKPHFVRVFILWVHDSQNNFSPRFHLRFIEHDQLAVSLFQFFSGLCHLSHLCKFSLTLHLLMPDVQKKSHKVFIYDQICFDVFLTLFFIAYIWFSESFSSSVSDILIFCSHVSLVLYKQWKNYFILHSSEKFFQKQGIFLFSVCAVFHSMNIFQTGFLVYG